MIVGSPWLYWLTERGHGFHQYAIVLSFALIYLIIYFLSISKIRWQAADLVLAVIWLLQIIWIHEGVDAKSILAELSWFPVYYVCGIIFSADKDFKTVRFTGVLILASCILQCVIALFQGTHLIPANHSVFSFTGSFYNPGPLGGYVAVGAVVTAVFWMQVRKRISKFGFAILFLILVSGIIMSRSRAAFMSLFAGLATIVVFKTRIWGFVIALGAMAVIMGLLLYAVYPASADARILIWKVSCRIIEKEPLLGHGTGSFASQYMWAQADYFETGTHTLNERILADDNIHPFNEGIRFLCEYGIVGSVIVLCALIWLATCSLRSRTEEKKSLVSVWLTFLVFGMFSYPIDVMPLNVLSAVLLSSFFFSARNHLMMRLPLRMAIAIVSCLLLFGIALYSSFLLRVEEDVRRTLCQWNPVLDNTLRQEYEYFRHDMTSVDRFAASLSLRGLYEEALPAKEYSAQMLPTGHKLMSLGECYLDAGDSLQAEKLFCIASYMLPAYVRPRYLCFKLYVESSKTDEAVNTAIDIVNQPIKKETAQTRKMVDECRLFLEEYAPGMGK